MAQEPAIVGEPIPRFGQTPVRILFHPAIRLRDRRLVMAGVNGIVARVADSGGKPDQLAELLLPNVAQYGYTARLLSLTAESIDFAVTRQ